MSAPARAAFAPRSAAAPAREFVNVGRRQLLVRSAGSGPAVIALAPLPYSSAVLEPLIMRLARDFTVFAPDSAGYGRSDRLEREEPAIEDFAQDLVALVDALELERFALVGVQFGALVALAAALTAPDRVESLVLRELPLFAPELGAQLRARYVPQIVPRADGGHLLEHWLARRNEHVFFPWYDTARANRLDIDLSLPGTLERRLDAGVLEQMLAGDGLAVGYRAMFSADVAGMLAAITVPATVVESASDLIPASRRAPLDGLARARTAMPGEDELDLVAELVRSTGAPPADLNPPQPIEGAMTRTFAVTPFGRLLARRMGPDTGTPVLMLHPSPGSGLRLEPLMRALCVDRPVVILDTLGNGDSDKPTALLTPTIEDYAVVFEAAADDLGLDRFDLYGSHTGAVMAIELALRAGERVRSLVLDGITLFSEQENAKFLDGYFVDLAPEWDGTHLIRAWSTVCDGRLWFPWHDRRPANIAPFELLDPAGAQAYVLEMLKSGQSYPLSYQAVFTHRTAERLAELRTRTLVCHVEGDPLARFTEPAAALVPGATALALASARHEDVAPQIAAFLDRSPQR